MPDGCAAATFSVAPTVMSSVPPSSVPVAEGLLLNPVTVIVLPPLVMVSAEVGSVMAKVYPSSPETVKLAVDTVPDVRGRVAPPEVDLAPRADNITVPAVVDCTATLPKFISAV